MKIKSLVIGLFFLSVFSYLLATVLPGQQIFEIEKVTGPANLSAFGRSVSGLGDINQDGFSDYIVGAPLFDGPLSEKGLVTVFSGKDASTIYSYLGAPFGGPFGSLYGWSVSNAGDVDADGTADFIVGGARFNNVGGIAIVYSGAAGNILYTFIDNSNTDFGVSVSGAGDVNNDGFDDVIVGATEGVMSIQGTATIYSGFNGSVIRVLSGTGHGFGGSVSGAGDINQDGFDDVIVGSAGSLFGQSAQAEIFSGFDGSVLMTFNNSLLTSRFGCSVDDIGDIDHDGYPDVIIGAFQDQNSLGNTTGSASVYSGQNGNLLYKFFGLQGELFGSSVSGAGDVNGDGYIDVVAGSEKDIGVSSPGVARVYSGKDGSVLNIFNGDSTGDQLGSSVSGAGDVNGDGFADVIVGADEGLYVGPGPGYAKVFSSIPLTLSSDVNELSMSQGGAQTLTFKGPVSGANLTYAILGSISGTIPGTVVGVLDPVTIPLNSDSYTDFTLNYPNNALMPNSFGTLNAQGEVTVHFILTPGLISGPVWEGVKVQHSLLVFNSAGVLIFASNPVPVSLIP